MAENQQTLAGAVLNKLYVASGGRDIPITTQHSKLPPPLPEKYQRPAQPIEASEAARSPDKAK